MSNERRNFTSQEKIAILRRHFLDNVPVSDLCEQYHLKPATFYHWQKIFFENGYVAFEQKRNTGKAQARGLEKEVVALREKLRRKDEVLSELLEEHVQLKKSLGEI